VSAGGLFQLRRYRRKLGIQLGTKIIHDSDDGDRNAGSEKAILNRSRVGFTLREGFGGSEKFLQDGGFPSKDFYRCGGRWVIRLNIL
jgi:hypothetical protein